MATLGTLKTAISARLIDTGGVAVSGSQVVDAINQSIQKWKKKRYWFNVPSTDYIITSGDSTITLPSDFLSDLRKNTLVITDSGSKYEVVKKSPSDFDACVNTTSTGRPRIYTLRNSGMEIYYTADQDYTAKFRYMQDYSDFATDGTEDANSNDFIDNAEALVRYDALSRCFGELRQDEKMEAYYTARALDEHNELLSLTRKRDGTGTLNVEQ